MNWLINLVPLTATFGAIVGGFMASKGRRFTLIIMDFISIVSVAVQLYAIN